MSATNSQFLLRELPAGCDTPDALDLPAAAAAIGTAATAETAQRLLDTFTRTTVFSPAPPRPGVVVLDVAGIDVVPVFSSRDLLAHFTGPGAWFGTTGLDLLGLLPEGVLIALDPNGPAPVLLDPAAATLEYAVIVHGTETSRDAVPPTQGIC